MPPVVRRMPISSSGIGLPNLDDRVGHRVAGAVPQQSLDDDVEAVSPRRSDDVAVRDLEAEVKEWDRPSVRVCCPATSGLHRVALAARAARCRSGSRAPTRAPSRRDRSRRPAAARARCVRHRVEDRIVAANSGSPGKYICVTSRVRKLGAEQREVDVRRPPGVVVVAPRIRAGLDRHEPVAAVVVGDGAAGAGEVRIERRRCSSTSCT